MLTFDLNNGNDEPFTWTMDKALDAGSKYTYEVRLHRTKVEITSASITGLDTGKWRCCGCTLTGQ